MFSRIVGPVVFVVMGWWLWNGPIHDMRTVTFEEQMQANEDAMARCLLGMEYAAGATGNGNADPEAQCAKRNNLYQQEGHWYSYDSARKTTDSNNTHS